MNDRRRFRWRLAAMLCGIAGVVLAWRPPSDRIAAQAPPAKPHPTAESPGPAAPPLRDQWVGTASCAAASCHGRTAPAGSVGAEYTTFITRDPHAKAYEVLFDERSVRMASLLREAMQGKPAHESFLCLDCHAPGPFNGGPRERDFDRSFGVGCEECHGLASEWLNPHTTAAWQRRGWKGDDAEYKFRLGMFDTKNISTRTLTCAWCHVGRPYQEVNHEMIAAGHPRLVFEFSSLHDRLPKHWRERRTANDPRPRDHDVYADWHARAWLFGQFYAATEAMSLLSTHSLASMTDPYFGGSLPALADFECRACHQPIRPTDPTRRQVPSTSLVPAEWYTVVLPFALKIAKTDAESVKEIRQNATALADGKASRSQIATNATRLEFAVYHAQLALADEPINVSELRSNIRELTEAADGNSDMSWDRATQTAFAIQAFQRTLSQLQPSPNDAKITQLVGRLVETVWPSDANGRRVDSYSAAKAFQPARFAERIRELHDAMQ